MKSFTSLIAKSLIVLTVAGLSFASLGAKAAAQQVVYVPGEPLPSFEQPVFNTYTNVPFSVGNEADFVRVRPSTGSVTDNGTTGQRNSLYVDTLSAACNVGDMYDVRTYIHNGADPDFNNNGSGTAVAHNTTVNMTAPLNQTGKNFTFTTTISASNAATVSDTGTLKCASNVRLQLVPTSVKVYSKALGWQSISDNAVNGSTKVGTHSLNSGDVWGCWDERVLVAYVVKVVEVPQVPQASCDLLTVTALGERKYKFDVKYTAKNGATFKEVRFDYGDGNTGTDAHHTYDKDGTYTVVATVAFMINGQMVTKTSDTCAKNLTVSTTEYCPVPGKGDLPKNSPECAYCPSNHDLAADDERCVTPTSLPNTGAGSVIGLFAAVSAAGAAAYRFVLRRRTA